MHMEGWGKPAPTRAREPGAAAVKPGTSALLELPLLFGLKKSTCATGCEDKPAWPFLRPARLVRSKLSLDTPGRRGASFQHDAMLSARYPRWWHVGVGAWHMAAMCLSAAHPATSAVCGAHLCV